MKRKALRLLGRPAARTLLSPMRRGYATIFMLHRFQDPARDVKGHPPDAVRRVLEHLRSRQVEIVPLATLFDRLDGDGPRLNGAVAFTIDDGYYDHARIAAPVFAEFDCPVTTFVTTGFLDNQLWFWWDRIEYVIERTAREHFSDDLAGVRISWEDESSRHREKRRFTEHCKLLPDAAKHEAIQELAKRLDVDLPLSAPPAYEPMTWPELRACEGRGMTFAPHTVTHPVLTRAAADQAEREIAGSWARLREEAADPVPVFCYPNGQRSDYGEREIGIIRRLGLHGAVVGVPGYAGVARFKSSPNARFEVPRFSFTEDMVDVMQIVTGFERLKQILRRERAL